MSDQSYLQRLLTQAERLDNEEIIILKDWLAILEDDVEIFGETQEDNVRMNAIRTKVAGR